MDRPNLETSLPISTSKDPHPITATKSYKDQKPPIPILTGENLARFELFYRNNWPALLQRAKRSVPSEQEAEDLVQRALEKELPYFAVGKEVTLENALRALRQLTISRSRHMKVEESNGNVGSFERLYEILGDDIFRQRANKDKDPTADIVITGEMIDKLGSTLTPEQRQTLSLYSEHGDNISMKELSELLGIKESAAKMKLKRARDKIQAELRKHNND